MKKKLSILALLLASVVMASCDKGTSTSVSTPESVNTPTSVSTPESVNPPTSVSTSESVPDSTSVTSPSEKPSTPVSVDTTVHVTKVTVNKTSLSMVEGETQTVTATVLPENATDKSISWKTSNAEVATVAGGVITAVKEGSATITVTTTDGGHTATVNVVVAKPTIHVTNVSLSETNLEIEEGETHTVTATVLPENASDKSVRWETSNAEVATVVDGVITAVKEGSATITVTTTDGNHVATVSVAVTKHFAISVGDTAGVSNVAVAEKAKEGELVEITLTYDEAALVVNAVKANDVSCGTSNGKYYFYMPAENVEISVMTSAIINHYVIKNENKNSVTLLGDATAVAGEEVSLPFSIAPGYNFNGTVTVYGNLDAFDLEDRTIVPSTVQNGVITFTMPAENVAIEVGVNRAYFQLTKVDANYHINTVSADGKSVSVSSGKYDIKYDSTVEIAFTQSSSYLSKLRPVGIHIPELNRTIMDSDDDKANSVSFKMPHFDITVEVITEKVYRNFTITNSEHISVLAYTKDEDGNYVALDENKAVYGDNVYLKATISDETTYAVKSLKGTYRSGTSTYTSTLTPSLEADGYYKFVMPEVSTGTTLDIMVAEKNITLFAGASFLGTYKGFNSYQTNISSASTTLTIDASGAFVKGSDEYTIENAENGELSLVKSDNSAATGRAYYDDKMIASAYTIGKDIFTADMNVYFKVEANDVLTVYAQRINSKYHVGEILKNNEPYVSYFIDPDNDIIYTGVSFDFTEGSHVNDVRVNYTIKDKNNRAIVSVSGTNLGSRTVNFYSGFEGEYTLDGETLVVNTTTAVYNDHTWSYTKIDDNTICMQYADSEQIHDMVVTLGTDGIATLVSATDRELPPVYSKAFYGKTAYNYYLHIYFKNPDTAVVYCAYDLTQTVPSSSHNGYDGEARYSYDDVANTITVTSNGESIVLEINDDGTLTIISGAFTSFTGSVDSDNPTFTEFTPTI